MEFAHIDNNKIILETYIYIINLAIKRKLNEKIFETWSDGIWQQHNLNNMTEKSPENKPGY